VLVAGAIAALAATTGHRTAATHVATPATVGHGGPAYQLLGKVDASSDVVVFGCQTRPPSSASSSCYGPQQIWKAYGIDKLQAQGLNGAGRSVTIIDAYGDPNMQAAIDAFDATFGLPNTTVNVIHPDGPNSPTTLDNAFGWQVETDLDVEWAHAIAPGATINLVVAKSNNDADILSAQKYVADQALGDSVSQSFGENEACMGTVLDNKSSAAFAQMGARGQTVFASSGDDGAAQSTCDGDHLVLAVSSPATDPGVTAVGGTQLTAKSGTGAPNVDNGDYISETTWWEYNTFGGRTSSGGGVSTLIRVPKDQQGHSTPLANGMRLLPDVAYNAAIQGGVIVLVPCTLDTCGITGIGAFRVGGTSAGSPQWAGLRSARCAEGRREDGHRPDQPAAVPARHGLVVVDVLPRRHDRQQHRSGRLHGQRDRGHRLQRRHGLGRRDGPRLAEGGHPHPGTRRDARQRPAALGRSST